MRPDAHLFCRWRGDDPQADQPCEDVGVLRGFAILPHRIEAYPALPAGSNIGRELQRGRIILQVVRIGLDLAKYVFEVHGVDEHGNVVMRKTLRRVSVSRFFANLPHCLVGMEASNGAHYWAPVLTDLGHNVRLISPQFVTPYVKSNKNDRNDAEAICEAVGRPTMRFVPPKSPEQLAVQALHRIRQRLVQSRTRLVNQIRGILSVHGIVIARDIWRLRRALAEITGNATDDLNALVRLLIIEAQTELIELDRRIASCGRRIRELYRSSELCQRLGEIEGSDRSPLPPLFPPSGIEAASRMAVSSLHGWGLYRSSGQVEGETDCSASANAAIAICAR